MYTLYVIYDPTVPSGTDCTSYLWTLAGRWSKERPKHVAIVRYQYRGADKSLARPGSKQVTVNISDL